MLRATALLIMALLLGLAPSAFAQGCALCRAAAAAAAEQTPRAGNALNLAILVLLVPTISIFVGILLWAFRYRNRSLAEQARPGDTLPLPLAPPAADSSFFKSFRRN